MSQVYEMAVIELEGDGHCGLVTLRGKFDPVYTSQLYLRVPLGELSKFAIGQSYSLTAPSTEHSVMDTLHIVDWKPVPVIETVPLGGAEVAEHCGQKSGAFVCTLDKGHSGQHEAWGTTAMHHAWSDAADEFADGSPVPAWPEFDSSEGV